MIGKKIRELRYEYRLSQKQLAKKMSIAQTTLSKYENDLLELHAGALLKLCEIFDVSADYLLGRADY